MIPAIVSLIGTCRLSKRFATPIWRLWRREILVLTAIAHEFMTVGKHPAFYNLRRSYHFATKAFEWNFQLGRKLCLLYCYLLKC